ASRRSGTSQSRSTRPAVSTGGALCCVAGYRYRIHSSRRLMTTNRCRCSEADVYLTRFRMNTARRGAQKLLSSPQAMHAAVLASFPEPPTGGDGPRVLWRVDETRHARAVLYIASPT